MSVQLTDGPTKTILAGAAFDIYLRVLHDGSDLALAGVNDVELGTIEQPSTAAADYATVRMRNASGTQIFIASGSISKGARVYAAASGKVSATVGPVYIGIALTAPGADGDWVEVARDESYQFSAIEHHTAADTLTKEESGSTHTNLAATGAILLTLPQDAPAGCVFDFVVMAAQQLRVDPGAAGAVYIGGAKAADNKYVWADDEAESIRLVADGNGDWVALFTNGTWTVET